MRESTPLVAPLRRRRSTNFLFLTSIVIISVIAFSLYYTHHASLAYPSVSQSTFRSSIRVVNTPSRSQGVRPRLGRTPRISKFRVNSKPVIESIPAPPPLPVPEGVTEAAGGVLEAVGEAVSEGLVVPVEVPVETVAAAATTAKVGFFGGIKASVVGLFDGPRAMIEGVRAKVMPVVDQIPLMPQILGVFGWFWGTMTSPPVTYIIIGILIHRTYSKAKTFFTGGGFQQFLTQKMMEKVNDGTYSQKDMDEMMKMFSQQPGIPGAPGAAGAASQEQLMQQLQQLMMNPAGASGPMATSPLAAAPAKTASPPDLPGLADDFPSMTSSKASTIETELTTDKTEKRARFDANSNAQVETPPATSSVYVDSSPAQPASAPAAPATEGAAKDVVSAPPKAATPKASPSSAAKPKFTRAKKKEEPAGDSVIDNVLSDPKLQEMIMPYLPENMRDEESLKMMLQNPTFKAQLEKALTTGGLSEAGGLGSEIASPESKPLKPFTQEEIMEKVVDDKDLAKAFENPKVRKAIFDSSLDPTRFVDYSNDKEIMTALKKIASAFPADRIPDEKKTE